MKIVMNCLGMPFDGNTLKTESLGGSETACLFMAKELVNFGHDVIVFTAKEMKEEKLIDGVKYIPAGEQSEQTPFGASFHFYAMNTPHDVCIIQRHPLSFHYKWASKINLLWMHDLALYRSKDIVTQGMWNVDGVLVVSEFHKEQVHDVYGIPKDFIHVIRNGIDLATIQKSPKEHKPLTKRMKDLNNPKIKKLCYMSRPERGLDNLVIPNGIMETLGDEYHLYVCTYNNLSDQMREFYNWVWGRCEELPNVTNMGFLNKTELFSLLKNCDLLVYPTPGVAIPGFQNFEEVSCITMMESAACGLPVVTSNNGALSETCKGLGVVLNSSGLPIVNEFVESIKKLFAEGGGGVLKEKQLKASESLDWSVSAASLNTLILGIATKLSLDASTGAALKHLLKQSDIVRLKQELGRIGSFDAISDSVLREVDCCYKFMQEDSFKEHYKKYYDYEKQRGVCYGAENLEGNSRFEYISSLVSGISLNDSGVCTILDYGCAHGHYTINLAKRFSDKQFIGVDINAGNIETARKWAEDEGLQNVEFFVGEAVCGKIEIDGEKELPSFSGVIAAEVLEHVNDPIGVVRTLQDYAWTGATIILCTPYGPWEAIGYTEHWPWRAHIHHFDIEDLQNLYGHLKDFKIRNVPAGTTKEVDSIGSYVYTYIKVEWEEPKDTVVKNNCKQNYAQEQTVSLCILLRDCQNDLMKCLESCHSVISEIVAGIDINTTPGIDAILSDFSERYHIPVRFFGVNPTETGFDGARNIIIEKACGDWIFWMDSDEILLHPENIHKYLRNHMFNGFALPQNHFSMEPAGVLRVDYPVKLFRNHKGIKFFGRVHEHPEINVNEGVGCVTVLNDVVISHFGYTDENTRRDRFKRNIGLLEKDREDYPERELGHFLWLRDLGQSARYHIETGGSPDDSKIKELIKDGVLTWNKIIVTKGKRLALEALPFYSELNRFCKDSVNVALSLGLSEGPEMPNFENNQKIEGTFRSREELKEFISFLMEDDTKELNPKYM